MGQALIGIDSSIFIYLLEKHPKFGTLAKTILKRVERGEHQGVFSIIGLIEVLTGPKQKRQFNVAQSYKNYIQKIDYFSIRSISDNIVELASDLRAKYGLRTPDAIHIATALDAGAKAFITNDRRLKKIKEIKIETLA